MAPMFAERRAPERTFSSKVWYSRPGLEAVIVLHGLMDCRQTNVDRYAADVGSVYEF